MALGSVLVLPALLGLLAGAPADACADDDAWASCMIEETRVFVATGAWNGTANATDALDAPGAVPGIDGSGGAGLADPEAPGPGAKLLGMDLDLGFIGASADVGSPNGTAASPDLAVKADTPILSARYEAILARHQDDAARPPAGAAPTAPQDEAASPAETEVQGEAARGAAPRDWVVPAIAIGSLPIAAATLPWTLRLPWRRILALPLAFGLYSRIRPDDLLDNDTRRAMQAALEEEPGRSIQELRDALGIAWGTTVYHLDRLERGGVVVSHRAGNHRRYYLTGSPEARLKEGMSLLEADTPRRLAQAVIRAPGVNQSTLCAEVGIRHPVASKYLRRMERHQLIQAETRDRFRCYTATSRLRELAPRIEA